MFRTVLKMRKSLLIALFAFCVVAANAVNGDEDKLSKPLQKEYKSQMKQLKKEGWKIMNSAQSLEKAMISHFLVVQKCGIDAIILTGEGESTDYNRAYSRASNKVAAQYASMKGSDVKSFGETVTKNENGATVSSESSYKNITTVSTKQKVGNLIPTVVMYRMLDKGIYMVRALYVIESGS